MSESLRLGAIATTVELPPEARSDGGFDVVGWMLDRAVSRLRVEAHNRGLSIDFDSFEIEHTWTVDKTDEAIKVEGVGVGEPKAGPDAFRAVTDDLTSGDGCACHTGIGYKSTCAHCSGSESLAAVSESCGYPNCAIPHTKESHDAYAEGFNDGSSDVSADWQAALTEWCELPDEVPYWNPTAVAHYIADLQGKVLPPSPSTPSEDEA